MGKDAAVLTALTLGDKHLLDHETRESFSTAGAMHLLAVSGLHVGMIWLVLDFLLRFPGHRLLFRLLKSILILIILWIYASVTGFSESVTRSVTMFSVLTLSRIIHRESNIYNTLLLSAFIMLLLHPLRISDAGFQLSFLAVLGIVSIQPVWEAFAQARSRILRYLRGLLTVSISAQVATLPLSLHLFHRFPLWFLLTNLAAIPLVSIILCFFVVSLPWIMISPDPEIPVRILLFLVHILNEAIELISGLPHAVIENITVSPLLAFMFYLCIFFFVLFMRYRRFWPLVMTLSVILLTTFLSALEEYNLKQKNLLDIYNIKGQSVISFMRYPNRITYRYNPGKDTVAFTENYINSLSAYPAHIKYHDCVYVDQDSMNLRSDFCELTDGVYSIFIDSLKMLVAGACTDYEMEFIIERQEFDLVLLTHGFPRTDSIRKFTDTGLLIGDGSLSFWEIEWLEEHAPNVFLTRNNGAFSMEFYTGLSFWQ